VRVSKASESESLFTGKLEAPFKEVGSFEASSTVKSC
jgi:hypothetical protein